MKTIIITGASRGIGAALAKEMADASVRLLLVGRNLKKLDCVAAACKKNKATVIIHQADVTDAEFPAWIEEMDHSHAIDLVIANAGVSSTISENGSPEPFDQVQQLINVNFKGVINTVNPLIKKMQERGHGQIALMSSIAAFRGLPQCPTYSATKAAVLTYGESLRTWLKLYGIKVSVICPGFVETAMCNKLSGPKPFLMPAEKAAKIILVGLERNKAEIAFPKRLSIVTKMAKLLPRGVMDRVLNVVSSSVSE
jgi:short-subunit dehydrogenase